MLAPAGRFVLGDVVVPDDPDDVVTPIETGYVLPERVAEKLEWLRARGLRPARDLVVEGLRRDRRGRGLGDGAELLAPVRVERAQPADPLAERRVRDEQRASPSSANGLTV